MISKSQLLGADPGARHAKNQAFRWKLARAGGISCRNNATMPALYAVCRMPLRLRCPYSTTHRFHRTYNNISPVILMLVRPRAALSRFVAGRSAGRSQCGAALLHFIERTITLSVERLEGANEICSTSYNLYPSPWLSALAPRPVFPVASRAGISVSAVMAERAVTAKIKF